MKNALFGFRENTKSELNYLALTWFSQAIADQVKLRGFSATISSENTVLVSQSMLGVSQTLIVELSVTGDILSYPYRFSSNSNNGSFVSPFIEFFVDRKDVKTPLQDLIVQKVASCIDKLKNYREPWWIFYKKKLPPTYFLKSALERGLFNQKDFQLIPSKVEKLSHKHFLELLERYEDWLRVSRHNENQHWSDKTPWYANGKIGSITDAFWKPALSMLIDFDHPEI